ncbi:cupin domain-containing protein [Spirillospora sp. CA-294931]|uniref:cupin domain-containing protein n=1 Tax=Spirillospora sp. CA-294931 TaxID=3240042 RepID=UPI003D946E2C
MEESISETLPPIVLVTSDDGEIIDYNDGDVSVVLASGEGTGGAFSVVEHRLGPKALGPPLHRHQRLCDSFYVLEGTVTFRVEDRTVEGNPGAYVCFPPGVAHTFRNDSDQPVRVLNINAPGGWDRVLRDVAAASRTGAVGPAETGRIAARYDMIVLE